MRSFAFKWVAQILAIALLLDPATAQAWQSGAQSVVRPCCATRLADQALAEEPLPSIRQSLLAAGAAVSAHIKLHASLLDPWKRRSAKSREAYERYLLIKAPLWETIILFTLLVKFDSRTEAALIFAALHTALEWLYVLFHPSERPASWSKFLGRQILEFGARFGASYAFLLPTWVIGLVDPDSLPRQLLMLINAYSLSAGLHSAWNALTLHFPFLPRMSMGLNLSHGLKLTQNVELKQELKENLVLRNRLMLRQALIYKQRETLARRLWKEAIKDGRIVTYDDGHGMKFNYARVNKNGLSAVEKQDYDAIMSECGHAFAQPVFSLWAVLLMGRRYAMARGEWLLCVEENFFGDFEMYPASHEFGEQITGGNHHLASKLEFATAARDNRLHDYLRWLRDNDPRKLRDAYTNRTFGGEQDKDPELAAVMAITLRDEAARKIRERIETFRWPLAVEAVFRDYEASNSEVAERLQKFKPRILAYLQEPWTDSPESNLVNAEREAERLFSFIRELNISAELDIAALGALWNRDRSEFSQAYDKQVQQYRAETMQDIRYGNFIQKKLANLYSYKTFGKNIDVLIGRRIERTDEEKQAAETAALGALSSDDPFNRALAAGDLGELLTFSAIKPLIGALAADTDATVRQAAVTALGQLYTIAPDNEKYALRAALGRALSGTNADKNAAVRNVVLAALYRIPNLAEDFSMQPVMDAMEDKDFYVRIDAVYVLLAQWGDVSHFYVARELTPFGNPDFICAILEAVSDPLLFITPQDTELLRAIKEFKTRTKDVDLKLLAQNALDAIKQNSQHLGVLSAEENQEIKQREWLEKSRFLPEQIVRLPDGIEATVLRVSANLQTREVDVTLQPANGKTVTIPAKYVKIVREAPIVLDAVKAVLDADLRLAAQPASQPRKRKPLREEVESLAQIVEEFLSPRHLNAGPLAAVHDVLKPFIADTPEGWGFVATPDALRRAG